MGETRKLAAILAADVVGYSRMMGEDEAGTARAVREHRQAAAPMVRGFGGRLVKTMGDGVLLEFPSVVAAVECAILMQQQMAERNASVPEAKRILYRIGVNLGDVLVEGDDILGDGVNIAARLEGICEPGGVLISGAAYDHVRGRIDADFADLGEKDLKNITQPVRVYALGVGEIARASASTPLNPAVPVKLRAPALLGVAALLIVIAAGGLYWFIANRPAAVATGPRAPVASNAAAPVEAKHLSIVVLPFTNLSGDPAQDYFADGITENLTTDLSRIRNSFVIARNTAFAYKGKNLDAKEIGKELGVRYVLEGSVQRDQNRVRVNAQLIDAETRAHLWADRFDEDVADLFKLQDEVVARLANTLGVELVKAEAEKAARSKNPDAVDLTMRGWALARTSQQTREKSEAARALFEQALKIDPNNTDALAGGAYTFVQEYLGWRNPETDYDTKILGPTDRAIALAPDTGWAYYVKCVYLYYSHRADKAIDVADAGLAINPNFPLWGVRGNANLFDGRFEQAKSDIQQAIRLSPHDPLVFFSRKYLGDAELGLRQFDAAIDDYHRAIDLGMHDMWPYVSLAAANALAGKMDDAKSALAEAQRLEPKLTSVKWLVEETHAPNLPPLYEGLRKAGLPEDTPTEPAHLSIVVLPFTNLSGDPAQDYFADGITENLTTDLSRIRNSFVIARNTAFTYKSRSVDAKAIGRELGVRYVLEGSVQRDQNRVRVNAQLVDAESGAHLWADRFEEDLADLFKLQDQVVAQLANALRYELGMAEAAKGARAQNPDAIDLAMRGWAMIPVSLPSKEQVNSASPLFQRALKLDPDNSEALAGKASTSFFEYVYAPKASVNYDSEILGPVERAIALDRGNLHAYRTKGQYLAVSGRPEDAVRALDAGLAIDPNAAGLLAMRSNAKDYLRRFEQAKSDIQQAMLLSPRDPSMGQWFNLRADSELGLGRFDEALEDAKKAIDRGHRVFYSYINLAAAHAFKGETDEAKAAMAEARRLNPDLSVKWLETHKPVLKFAFEQLREAGLPEE